MSVERRLVQSFGATLLGPVVTIGVQLVNVPVMLRSWGPALYGEWLILTAIPTYLLLSDMGFGNVAGSDMTMRVNAGDRAGALETMQSTMLLVLLLSAGIAWIVAAVLMWAPVSTLLHLRSISPGDARVTLALLSINCLVMLQWSVIMAGYRAAGRYALGMLYVNAIRMIEAASFLAILFTGAGPAQLAGLMLMVSVVGTAWLLWDHRRHVPWLPPGLRSASLVRVRTLMRPAFAFMAFPACAAIGTQGMTLTIGMLLGPAAVALFNPLRTLARTALQLTDSVKNAAWPELSAAYGLKDWPMARRLHRSCFQLSMLMALGALTMLVIAGPRVFVLWTGHRLAFDAVAFDLLLLAVLANSAWNASSAVPLSANRHEAISHVYLGLSVLSLGVAWLAVPRWGLRGAAVAMLFADLGMSLIVVRTSLRMLHDSARSFVRAMFDLEDVRRVARKAMQRVRPIAGSREGQPVASRSIPSLDGLRAVSVLMVIGSHFNGWSGVPKHGALHTFMILIGQGGLGVSTFFVISGFLITTLLLNEQERHGRIDLPRFYLRRSLRIFPPYYVYLAIAAAVAWGSHRAIPWPSMLSAAMYVSNYYPNLWSHPEGIGWYVGHTWSLSVEEQFYLFWPVLLVFARGRRAVRWCVAIVIVVPLLRLATIHALPIYATNQQWFRLFHTTVDTLATGCLLAFAMRRKDFREAIERLFHPAMLLAVYAYLASSSAIGVHAPAWFMAIFGMTLNSLCIALLMSYVVLKPETIAGRVLGYAPLRHLGMISYSLYLWQQIFLGPFWTPTTYRNVLAAFACAEGSYWLIERPVLRMRPQVERWFAVYRRRDVKAQPLATEAKSAA